MQTGLRLDQEVPVRLNDEQLLQRGQTLAEKISYRTGLVASKDSDAKKWNGLIKEADEEIARLGRVILDAYESRKQGDLFVGDEVAARTLAEVAKRAEEAVMCTTYASKWCAAHGDCACPDGADVASLDCPLHGPDSQHAKDAVAPLPTEPHAYVEKAGVEECEFCGAELDDPIHSSEDEGAAAATTDEATQETAGVVEPHDFAAREDEPTQCRVCGAELADPAHEVQGLPTIGTPVALRPEAGA